MICYRKVNEEIQGEGLKFSTENHSGIYWMKTSISSTDLSTILLGESCETGTGGLAEPICWLGGHNLAKQLGMYVLWFMGLKHVLSLKWWAGVDRQANSCFKPFRFGFSYQTFLPSPALGKNLYHFLMLGVLWLHFFEKGCPPVQTPRGPTRARGPAGPAGSAGPAGTPHRNIPNFKALDSNRPLHWISAEGTIEWKMAKQLDAGYPESPRQRYFDAFISQSMDTCYTWQLLHQAPFTTFTLDTFYTRHLLHQTLVTPDNFYNKQLLHQAPFTPETFYTRHLLHQTPLTPDTFYTKQILQQTAFTPGTLYNLYTRHFFHQTPVTTDNFYNTQLLHQAPFTPGTLYTRNLLRQTSFTLDTFYTRHLLHKELFAPDNF